MGSKKDVVFGTVLDETFFASEDSAETIQKGSKLKLLLPKMIEEGLVTAIEATEDAITDSVQPLMAGQIVLTLVLSVSLKQMWNLLNVM